MQEVAAWLGVTSMQVGLAWLLRHAPNILLIPGTASVEHLEQNLAIASVELDEEAMAEFDAIGAPRAIRRGDVKPFMEVGDHALVDQDVGAQVGRGRGQCERAGEELDLILVSQRRHTVWQH